MIIKNYTIEILVIIIIFGLLLYSSDPILYVDSYRFLKGSITESEIISDPPLYSTIILIMQSTFGSLNSVIILQTLFIGFGIIFFIKTISKYFNIDVISKGIIAIFLFLPILKFYNILLTESLSYAFSLFFVSFVVKLIYTFNIRNLFWTSILVVLLLLMRNQFLFLYPVILLLYLGILSINRSKKKIILLVISFIFIIFSQNSLSFLNKYIKQVPVGNNTLLKNNSGIFHYLYVDTIYISSNKDIELFKDESLKKTFAKIMQEVDNQKALVEYYNGRGHFGISFNIIIGISDLPLKALAIQKKTTVIDLKKKISIKLLKKNFKKYLKNLFKKFYDSVWMFIFIPFFMMLAAFINFFKKKSNFTLLIIFLSTFTLANHSIIYLFGRIQPRYFIYTDFILLIFIFIIFSIFLKKLDSN